MRFVTGGGSAVMADAVRRYREAGSSDVVRRLLVRPIRLDPPRLALQPAAPVSPVAAFYEEAPESIVADAPIDVAQDTYEAEMAAEEALDDADDQAEVVIERLRAEMALMKAILMAERAETAALRGRMEPLSDPDPIGDEARVTRDRWAGMVDRILLSAR